MAKDEQDLPASNAYISVFYGPRGADVGSLRGESDVLSSVQTACWCLTSSVIPDAACGAPSRRRRGAPEREARRRSRCCGSRHNRDPHGRRPQGGPCFRHLPSEIAAPIRCCFPRTERSSASFCPVQRWMLAPRTSADLGRNMTDDRSYDRQQALAASAPSRSVVRSLPELAPDPSRIRRRLVDGRGPA